MIRLCESSDACILCGQQQSSNNAAEEMSELEASLMPTVSSGLLKLMFAKDCQKHIQACDMISSALSQNREAFHSNLDNILHWLRLRMGDGNTQCLLRTLDTVQAIFTDLETNGEQLTDYELSIIVPALAERAGHNQDRIRQKHRELLALASNVCERHVKVSIFPAFS